MNHQCQGSCTVSGQIRHDGFDVSRKPSFIMVFGCWPKAGRRPVKVRYLAATDLGFSAFGAFFFFGGGGGGGGP